MKKIYLLLILVVSGPILQSCKQPCLTIPCMLLDPNQILIELYSYPAGAIIYEGNRSWGQAPVELKVTLPQTTCQVFDIYAVWPSGARSIENGLNICTAVGKSQTYKFSRPSNAPGLDIDLNYELRLRESLPRDIEINIKDKRY